MPFLFAVTLFVSAFLLFLIQLMVGKLVLPYLGGTPAVWNTCLVFFQAELLLGYYYADAVSRWLGARRQFVLHVGLLLLPLLPLVILKFDVGPIARDWLPPPTEANPIPWLVAVLLLVAGLPFLVTSTSAPLLQKWFSQTGHPSAKDPYFLYAASNLGSMLALMGYPVLIERKLGVPAQAWLWTVGYAVLVALTIACGLLARRGKAAGASVAPDLPAVKEDEEEGLTLGRRLRWVALAFVPSSLMMGATSLMTTDIAAIPLLWVLPLALYLLSFILVFSRLSVGWYFGTLLALGLAAGGAVLSGVVNPQKALEFVRVQLEARPAGDYGLLLTLLLTNVTVAAVLGLMWAPRLLHLAMVLLLPVGVVLVIWETLGSVALPFAEHPLRFGVPIWAAVGLHLTTLFLAAMVCHGELARTRPATRFLTEFYLLLSVGGVLGGLFNALVAPLVFSRIVEYPLVMALALLLLPRAGAPRERRVLFLADLNLGGVLGLIGLLVAAFWLGHNFLTQRAAEDLPEPFRGPATKFARRFGRDDSDSLLEERNFFGLVRVRRDPHDYYHWIVHGTTVHGLQCWGDPDRRKEPLAYFHEAGPMGEIWAAARAKKPNLRVAVLGVGSGTLAAFTRAGDEMTLYEIDPAVVRLVHDKTYFTYIPDAKERGVQVNVELGDGRLRLQQAPEEHFDLIFMDAFTSDAVPVHLLTREAIQTYLTKLAPGGVIIINVANRYLDFEPVFANLATELGLAARYGGGSSGYYNEEYNVYEQYGSAWIVLARNEEDLGQLLRYRSPKGKERWEKLAGREDVGVWTDDYSNLFSVFNWKR